MKTPRLLITSGEPAGVGPDVLIQAAQEPWHAELITIGDPDLLLARAKQLKLPLRLALFEPRLPADVHQPGVLKIIPLPLNVPCEAGILNKSNAQYVLSQLEQAYQAAAEKTVDALVTAPVHKGILNDAGFAFRGHTEFFAAKANIPEAVMLFVTKNTRVALATTHLALKDVPLAITQERLKRVLDILQQGLQTQFGIAEPVIYVCGLNPHAGEGGYLGKEEIEMISPALDSLRERQIKLVGPLPADTLFTEKYLNEADAILAMYHDQALPVVKYMGFGNAVNVTLGLPFIRTSVDHGTALDVAGTLGADMGSLKAAMELAVVIQEWVA